jgi:hypothetical protein
MAAADVRLTEGEILLDQSMRIRSHRSWRRVSKPMRAHWCGAAKLSRK